MKFVVIVTPKKGVLDPQGRAIKSVAEPYLGVEIKDIRVGKYFEVEIDCQNAREYVEKLASGVLSNGVIEDYEVREIEGRDS